ncbi:MAG TPA: lipid-binding SYLF domain-containing protein [Polyangiaceae bacterium]|nr:lipid-binding SYLF domain-containing protein [Polyangiaceae bacterium]
MSPFASATSRTVLLAALLGGGNACSRQEPARAPAAESAKAEQAIVERSADAFARLRTSDAPRLDAYVERAHGIMIFPRLVKASLIFGGEGGNGVLVAKGADGSWSNPAFYSLGAPSVGLQIGYQEATVVLFFMEESVLQKALHADISLGTNTSVALGRVGDVDASRGEVFSKPIYQLVEARGAFAGVSLDGYVISARNKHNQAYYGGPVTPRDILIERTQRRPEADVLLRALVPQPHSAPPQAAAGDDDEEPSRQRPASAPPRCVRCRAI